MVVKRRTWWKLMLQDLQSQSSGGIVVIFGLDCCFAYRSKYSLIVFLLICTSEATGGVHAGLADVFIAGRRRPRTQPVRIQSFSISLRGGLDLLKSLESCCPGALPSLISSLKACSGQNTYLSQWDGHGNQIPEFWSIPHWSLSVDDM